MAGTSPTVVTTFVIALSVLRLIVATPDWAAVTGESIAAEPVAERRTVAGVLVGWLAEATCNGDGWASMRAAAGLSMDWRRVAVLAGEISPFAGADATAPAADSAAGETAGRLGAPLRRVSVGAAAGSAAIAGASRPWARAVCSAGCAAVVERGSVAGISAVRAEVT